MKLSVVSVVKDESDIIELFIRINSRVVDEFFIVDNNSADNTYKILEELKFEGYNITIYRDATEFHQQSKMMTKALKSAHASSKSDWYFILDADEILDGNREEIEKELSLLPKQIIACIPWTTWIPRGDFFYDHTNPIWAIFNKRNKEITVEKKVVVSSHYANHVVIDEGNHRARLEANANQVVPMMDLKSYTLNHFPVRSSKQIRAKALIGSYRLSLKPNRFRNETFHWDTISELIRKENYVIDNLLLRYIALYYGDLSLRKRSLEELISLDDVDTKSKFGLQTDIIKYNHYYDDSARDAAKYDAFLKQLVNKIKRGDG